MKALRRGKPDCFYLPVWRFSAGMLIFLIATFSGAILAAGEPPAPLTNYDIVIVKKLVFVFDQSRKLWFL